MANLGEAAREHVLEEPREEGRRGQGAARLLTGAPVPIPKGDATVGEGLQAAIGDRDPEDVAPQIVEHAVPGASLKRIWMVVGLIVLGCFVGTVVLQNVGLAPAVRLGK